LFIIIYIFLEISRKKFIESVRSDFAIRNVNPDITKFL